MVLKKTTLLFEENVYQKLQEKAKMNKVSIGGMVREAVAAYYGIKTKQDRLEALEKLKSLGLKTGSPEKIEKEIINGALNDRENQGLY